MYDDEEREGRIKAVLKRAKSRRRCADGWCGADDCPRCRPATWRNAVLEQIAEEEEEAAENCRGV